MFVCSHGEHDCRRQCQEAAVSELAIRLVCQTIHQLIANGHRHWSDHPLFSIASSALKLSEVR